MSSLNRSFNNYGAEGLRRSALGGEGAASVDSVLNSFTSATSQQPPHQSTGLTGSFSNASVYGGGTRSLSGSMNNASVQGASVGGGAFSLEDEVRRLRNRVSELEAENRSEFSCLLLI